jgi:hypothetical protein
LAWSLKNFLIKRVGVVDSGDNPGAEVLLFKSDPEDLKDKGGVKNMTFEELMKSLPEEDKKLVTDEIDKVKDEEIKKTKEELNKVLVKPAGCSQEEWDAADMAGKLALMKKEDLTKDCGDGGKKKDEPSDEDLIKSADPKIQELVKKLQEDNDKKAEELKKEKEEKDAKDAELKKELLNKEADKFPNIGAKKEDIVKILEKSDEETSTLVKSIFAACNEALKDNVLMKSIGSGGDGDDKKASEKIEDMAKALVKDGKAKTIEIARTKVYKENPKLTEEARNE